MSFRGWVIANPPPLRRLYVEDFPDQKAWIGPLLQVLNEFMENVNFALNRQLTIGQNFLAQIKELDVVGGVPLNFATTVPGKVVGLWIVNAYEANNTSAVLTSALYTDWSQNNSQIIINNVSGLTAATKYKITFVVIGG